MKHTPLDKIIYAIVIVLLAAGAYHYQSQIATMARRLGADVGLISPCAEPVSYSIGEFDPQFGISKAQFISDINQAAQIWDVTVGKDFFQYSDTGDLTVNLLYDYRQKATDQLQTIGGVIQGDKATYDSLKAKYDSLSASYAAQKSALQASVDAYTTAKNAYEAKVSYWNSQGGAPKSQYAALNQEKDALNAQADAINQQTAALNSLGDTVNSTVNTLNSLAHSLNIQVSDFNTVGSSTGPEFSEGEYIQDSSGTRINIYQFNSQNQLIRVLAHELGHALGLQHVDDPKAIMYRLNEGTNATATDADIAELKAVCKIQ